MSNTEYLFITVDNIDSAQDLSDWLSTEYAILPVERQEIFSSESLGEEKTFKIPLTAIKKGVEKFVSYLKNWVQNYNKDIEIVFQNGEKSATIKCPSSRVSAENLDVFFSTLQDVFK